MRVLLWSESLWPNIVGVEVFNMRPVVAIRVGGLPEVVMHQETGLVVEPEDCVGLAEAVAFLLEHPEVAVQMGQAGRRRVQEVFRWQWCIDTYDALYKKLINTVTH